MVRRSDQEVIRRLRMPRILLGLIRSWKHCLIWIEGTQVLLGWDFVYSQHSSMNHTFSYLDSSDGFFEEDQALQSQSSTNKYIAAL